MMVQLIVRVEVIEQFKDSRIELYKQKRNQHICYVTNFRLSKVKGDYLLELIVMIYGILKKLEKANPISCGASRI